MVISAWFLAPKIIKSLDHLYRNIKYMRFLILKMISLSLSSKLWKTLTFDLNDHTIQFKEFLKCLDGYSLFTTSLWNLFPNNQHIFNNKLIYQFLSIYKYAKLRIKWYFQHLSRIKHSDLFVWESLTEGLIVNNNSLPYDPNS